jgi:hypothetical protein
MNLVAWLLIAAWISRAEPGGIIESFPTLVECTTAGDKWYKDHESTPAYCVPAYGPALKERLSGGGGE